MTLPSSSAGGSSEADPGKFPRLAQVRARFSCLCHGCRQNSRLSFFQRRPVPAARSLSLAWRAGPSSGGLFGRGRGSFRSRTFVFAQRDSASWTVDLPPLHLVRRHRVVRQYQSARCRVVSFPLPVHGRVRPSSEQRPDSGLGSWFGGSEQAAVVRLGVLPASLWSVAPAQCSVLGIVARPGVRRSGRPPARLSQSCFAGARGPG